jgi:hypothetical protein
MPCSGISPLVDGAPEIAWYEALCGCAERRYHSPQPTVIIPSYDGVALVPA